MVSRRSAAVTMKSRAVRRTLARAGRPGLVPALVLFAALAGVVALASRAYQRTLLEGSRAQLTQQLSSYATALSAAVTQRFALALGVRAFVQNRGCCRSRPLPAQAEIFGAGGGAVDRLFLYRTIDAG